MTIAPSLRLLAALVVTALVGACGVIPTFHPEHAPGVALGEDRVLLVGRIELIPPLGPTEQKLRIGSIDPADTRGKLHQRAVLFLSDRPEPTRRQTGSVINPRLGEWFVLSVPKSQRFVADASVFMEYEPLLYGRRQATINTAQLVLPALFDFDFRPGDQAVYVGTWRVWRDEFHQVTRFQAVNDLAGARAELARRGGPAPALRSAIPPQLQAQRAAR